MNNSQYPFSQTQHVFDFKVKVNFQNGNLSLSAPQIINPPAKFLNQSNNYQTVNNNIQNNYQKGHYNKNDIYYQSSPSYNGFQMTTNQNNNNRSNYQSPFQYNNKKQHMNGQNIQLVSSAYTSQNNSLKQSQHQIMNQSVEFVECVICQKSFHMAEFDQHIQLHRNRITLSSQGNQQASAASKNDKSSNGIMLTQNSFNENSESSFQSPRNYSFHPNQSLTSNHNRQVNKVKQQTCNPQNHNIDYNASKKYNQLVVNTFENRMLSPSDMKLESNSPSQHLLGRIENPILMINAAHQVNLSNSHSTSGYNSLNYSISSIGHFNKTQANPQLAMQPNLAKVNNSNNSSSFRYQNSIGPNQTIGESFYNNESKQKQKIEVNQQIRGKNFSKGVDQIIRMEDEQAGIKPQFLPRNSSYRSNNSYNSNNSYHQNNSYHSNNHFHSNYSYHSNGVNNNLNALNFSNQSLRNAVMTQQSVGKQEVMLESKQYVNQHYMNKTQPHYNNEKNISNFQQINSRYIHLGNNFHQCLNNPNNSNPNANNSNTYTHNPSFNVNNPICNNNLNFYVTSRQNISPNNNYLNRSHDHNNLIQPRVRSEENIFNGHDDDISSISQNSRYSLTENSQIQDFEQFNFHEGYNSADLSLINRKIQQNNQKIQQRDKKIQKQHQKLQKQQINQANISNGFQKKQSNHKIYNQIIQDYNLITASNLPQGQGFFKKKKQHMINSAVSYYDKKFKQDVSSSQDETQIKQKLSYADRLKQKKLTESNNMRGSDYPSAKNIKSEHRMTSSKHSESSLLSKTKLPVNYLAREEFISSSTSKSTHKSTNFN